MLADATRVQVLWALVRREMSVNELAAHVGKPAPSVSQHLAKLRMARLVRTRREGTTIFYRLENDHVAPAGHRRGVQRRTRRPGRARPSPHATWRTLHADRRLDTSPTERTTRTTHEDGSDHGRTRPRTSRPRP